MSMDNMRMVLTASRSTDWLEVICRSTPFRCLTDSHPPRETNLLGVTGKSSGIRSPCLLRKTPPTTRICRTQGITCLVYQIEEQKTIKKSTDQTDANNLIPTPFVGKIAGRLRDQTGNGGDPARDHPDRKAASQGKLRRASRSYARMRPFSRLSRIRVTGPSLVKDTCIIAPNMPVSTFTPWLRSSSLNRSYNLDAISGAAAAVKLGRRPFRQSPYRVNWDTDKMPPPTSRRERFIFPCSSSKMRRFTTFSAR